MSGRPFAITEALPTVREELSMVDAYCDSVPRAAADPEQIGGFTLFVGRPGRTYYARPIHRSRTGATRDDIHAVVARQRELGVPQEFEWVAEQSPALGDTARAAGLCVDEYALLTRRSAPEAGIRRSLEGADLPGGFRLRLLGADDRILPITLAAIGVAFGTTGSEVTAVGPAERDAAVPDSDSPGVVVTRDQIRRGLFVQAAAEGGGAGPVGGGSHSPRGRVTEITGVATLPSHRRRGIGAAVTRLLCADASERGVEFCFLSAGSADAVRVYERVGFVRVGTSCVARCVEVVQN